MVTIEWPRGTFPLSFIHLLLSSSRQYVQEHGVLSMSTTKIVTDEKLHIVLPDVPPVRYSFIGIEDLFPQTLHRALDSVCTYFAKGYESINIYVGYKTSSKTSLVLNPMLRLRPHCFTTLVSSGSSIRQSP